MEALLCRNDHSARIKHGRLKRAAFDRRDTSSGTRPHWNTRDVFCRKTIVFDEHSRKTIFAIANQSYGYFFAFEISDTFDARMYDEVPRDFLCLVEDRFQLGSFGGCPQSAAAGAAEIDVAADQRRDRRRSADDDGFVLQSFIFEEAFGF